MLDTINSIIEALHAQEQKQKNWRTITFFCPARQSDRADRENKETKEQKET